MCKSHNSVVYAMSLVKTTCCLVEIQISTTAFDMQNTVCHCACKNEVIIEWYCIYLLIPRNLYTLHNSYNLNVTLVAQARAMRVTQVYS